MKYSLDKDAEEPERAHPDDAGIDLCANEWLDISPHSGEVIHTGVHLEIPAGYAGLLVSKSGLNVKHDITTTGLIDSGYTGEIIVKAYNHGDKTYQVNSGDKITQLVLIPVATPTLVRCKTIAGGPRGNNGFGSTGK
ncbi:MAG: dUTP diphosphatase [Bifidobacterium mongoliense]|jgi:dUTP pyrophosphatase|uniref:dUTP diphosphatase n=1 Tax=Bifidobacterium mongoliense TaxID=518643 RepID=UPI002F359F3F